MRARLRVALALLKVGFIDAFAYRFETLVWLLSTTMPVVMFLLWDAVAKDAPVRGYTQNDFRIYFLLAFIVRQITGSWAAWTINAEVKDGSLGLKLLRPVHPIFAYSLEQVASAIFRSLVSVPFALVILFVFTRYEVPPLWGIVCACVSLVGAFMISLSVNLIIGFLAFVTDQSNRLMEIWATSFFVMSGYLVPLDLFPPSVVRVIEYLPFRFQMGLSIELLMQKHGFEESLRLLACQGATVATLWLLAALTFRMGVRRFEAFGG